MKWIPINNLVLTGPEAAKKFPNVKGQGFQEDSSCLAMLRAIVWPRMRPTDFIRFRPLCFTRNCKITAEGLKTAQQSIAQVLGDSDRKNNLLFLSFSGNMTYSSGTDMDAQALAWLNELAESVFDGYEHVQSVEKVAACDNLVAVAMINRSTHSAVFLCLRDPCYGYRLMECALTKLLPWYFPEEHLDRNGHECKLIVLLSKNIVAFSELLDKIGKRILRSDPPYDFRDLV